VKFFPTGAMVVFVAILLALTSYIDIGGFKAETDAPYPSSEGSLYSSQWVVLGNGDSPDDLTNTQVLATLYESPGTHGEYQ
jgi:hypothetical protein